VESFTQRVSQVLPFMAALAVHAAPCPEEQRGTLDEWKCFGQVEFAARTDVRRGWQGPCD
jgi:hypothetical protein